MRKKIIAIGVVALLSSCYSVKKTVENGGDNVYKIEWPDEYVPEESNFFVHNEIEINASPQKVWDVLIQAQTWEDWYEGADDIRFVNGSYGPIEANSILEWKTMGQYFTSTIKEYKAPYRLAWESEKKGIRGYHAWLIEPTDKGCLLITSESQHGFVSTMEKLFVPNKLHKLHDSWLAGIKARAESEENEITNGNEEFVIKRK